MFETTEKIFTHQKRDDSDRLFNIIHFNDVYTIENRDIEPVGGASRFVTALEHLIEKKPNTLVFFSGDALSPSTMSMVVKGKQMIEVLNNCQIACACLGNHDFDFGLDVLMSRVEESNFPWLISNVFAVDTKVPLGGVNGEYILEINGIKIGIMGLVEEEWLTTLSTIDPDDTDYEDFVSVGKRLANKFKTEDNCDYVIALTHMRWPNDTLLAEKVPEIDLFLGGHDHDYVVKEINDRWVVKSGTDFREFSYIQIGKKDDTIQVNQIEKLLIESHIEENPEIETIVSSYRELCNKGMEDVLGIINTDLEGRFSNIRTSETNLGNFLCDILLANVNADCAVINSGSIRSDQIHEKGEFKMKDLKKILPYIDECVVISVSGSILHQMLENSVSSYPKHEGRFLQVSGIKFAFDPSKPSGERIDPLLIKIQDQTLDLDKSYAVATKEYVYLGKDGYQMLKDSHLLVEGEDLPAISNMVVNHFKSISEFKENEQEGFRASIIPLITVNNIVSAFMEETFTEESQGTEDPLPPITFHRAASIVTQMLKFKQKALKSKRRRIKNSPEFRAQISKYEEKAMQLSPKEENRILRIECNEQYQELLLQNTIEKKARALDFSIMNEI